jgi:hypothetical protein
MIQAWLALFSGWQRLGARGPERRSLSKDDRHRAQENRAFEETFSAHAAGRRQSSRFGKERQSPKEHRACLLSSTRETDVIGWYKDRATVGVIFTGLLADDKNSS